MTEYIHLVGAEDVQRAAGRISSAADTMSNAASSIEGSLEMFLRQFEQLVCRLEEVEMGHSAELAARVQYLIDAWPEKLEDGCITFPDGERWDKST